MRKKKIIVFALLIFCIVMYHGETKIYLGGDDYTEMYGIETEETNY